MLKNITKLHDILPNHLKVSQYLMMLQEMIRNWVRNNFATLVVLAIGTAIVFLIGSGDVTAAYRGR